MKIGILESGHLPDSLSGAHGTYGDMFRALLEGFGFTFQTWAVVDDVFPDGPLEADGWLITGSRHGAYDDLPFIPRLETFIRAIVAADRPLVGVCFGHQIIAQALGGTVEKFSGGWSVGPQRYDGPAGPQVLNAWHQDQVTALPPGAEVVQSSDFCRNAALVYPGKAYTVQAHPEFADGIVQGLITERGPGVVPEALLRDAAQALGQPLTRHNVAEQFATFFKSRQLT